MPYLVIHIVPTETARDYAVSSRADMKGLWI
jgi:hypothetical protein